jgi:putative hydrolase of the HAD superfamily
MGARPLRAIFFDAGNTLLHMNYGAIAAALAARGIAVTRRALEDAEHRARVRLDDEVLARSAVSTESRDTGARYLRYLLAGVGVTDEATVAGLGDWRRAYHPPVGVWDVVAPGAAAALRHTRAAGLATGVISNSNGAARATLDAVGLTPYLDVVLDSHVVGVEKPDPRIFARALEATGVRPGEAAHVGDLYSVDVRGARAAGLEAVLLDPAGYWGARDCARAPDALAAVRLLLGA